MGRVDSNQGFLNLTGAEVQVELLSPGLPRVFPGPQESVSSRAAPSWPGLGLALAGLLCGCVF